MGPEEVGSKINNLIDSSDILSGSFGIEAGLMLAAAMVRDRKLGTALAWSSIGFSAASRAWKKYQKHLKDNRKDYVLKVSVDDPIFDVLAQWLLRDTPEHEQYTIEAMRTFNVPDSPYSGNPVLEVGTPLESSHRYKNLSVEIDDKRPMVLHVDGHKLEVKYTFPGQKDDDDNKDSPSVPAVAGSSRKADRYREDPHFLVTCPTLEARKALLRKIDASFSSNEKKVPSVYRADSWGDFRRVGDVPPRKLESVVLKPGQIESLVDNMSQFLESEDRYIDLGIPYHHGVLLYGPPGTGKTSIAAAVATALDLDVYAVQLSTLRDDANLADTFREVSSRSVLLLEDIDTCKAAREGEGDGDADGKGITIDGLLQALDGFAAPHGLITVLTTNNPELLDRRLIRRGRIDFDMEVDCVDTAQVVRLCEVFLGYVPEGLPSIEPSDRISPADCVGVFKDNLYNAADAGAALVKKLNQALSGETTPPWVQQNDLMQLHKKTLQDLAKDAGISYTDKTTKKVLVDGLMGK